MDNREEWQIEQGNRCGCKGSDEWCGCQNNMPDDQPRFMPDEIIAWPSNVTSGGEFALTGSWGARRHYTDEAVSYVPKAAFDRVKAAAELGLQMAEANDLWNTAETIRQALAQGDKTDG